jgi:hypothetical protein
MMNLNQKLVLLALSTMPLMPIVSNTAVTAQTTSAPQITQEASPSFVGRIWEPDNGKIRVQFFKKNNTYNGKIVWLPSGAETKDVKNPDPKLRSRNLIGSTMFQGFTYDPAKKQLTGGVVYIPDMGRIMKPKLSVVSEDRIEMTISMGIMSRTVALKPVK